MRIVEIIIFRLLEVIIVYLLLIKIFLIINVVNSEMGMNCIYLLNYFGIFCFVKNSSGKKCGMKVIYV